MAAPAPTDPFTRALADALRDAKERTPHTVRSLVVATGMGQSSVQRYLDGEREIPITKLRKLAAALDTTAGALMDDAEARLGEKSRRGHT